VKPKLLTPHLGLALPLCGCQDQHADKFRLYVLDVHMDKLVRIAAPATFAGTPQIARFKPLPNPAAGEQAGDTSLFGVRAALAQDRHKLRRRRQARGPEGQAVQGREIKVAPRQRVAAGVPPIFRPPTEIRRT
jgi:hypothetical protein